MTGRYRQKAHNRCKTTDDIFKKVSGIELPWTLIREGLSLDMRRLS